MLGERLATGAGRPWAVSSLFPPDEHLLRRRAKSPEHRLALAVLAEAIEDIETYRKNPTKPRQRAYESALDWIRAEDKHWDYSFVNLCEVFDLDPVVVRKQLLKRRYTGWAESCTTRIGVPGDRTRSGNEGKAWKEDSQRTG